MPWRDAHPAHAVIRVKGKRRKIARHRCLARKLRCAYVRHGRLIIGARSISAFQRIVNRDAFEWLVGRFVGEFELLPGSQPDHARYGQFLDGEVVLRLNQLLLPRLKFDFGAQAVDVRRSAGIHLVGGLIVERLGGFHLCFRRLDASFIGDSLQIRIAYGKHHEVAGVFEGIFGGFEALVAARVLLINFESNRDCVTFKRASK